MIIGLHDGPIDTPAGAATVEAVRQTIDKARALGYCFGVVDDTAHVVADRYVSSGRPIPRITKPVPYRLPLRLGQRRQPAPAVRARRLAASRSPPATPRPPSCAGRPATSRLPSRNESDRPTDGAPVNVVNAIPAGLIATGAAGEGWTCTAAGGRTCTRKDVLAPPAPPTPPSSIQVKVADDAPKAIVNAPVLTGHGSAWADDTTDRIPTIAPES